MNEKIRNQRQGTIVLILTGLIFVMLFFAIFVSKKMEGQARILTLIDATQVARFYLESYCLDVLRQTKRSLNDPNSNIYAKIRSATGKEVLPSDFYHPSSLMSDLAGEVDVTRHPPVISIIGGESLQYPKCLKVPELGERMGTISVRCSISLMKRKYSLDYQFFYKVAMVMNPMVREFVLFLDQISAEQTIKGGKDDKINVLLTKESDHPKSTEVGGGRPWILRPTSDKYLGNGQVFLGRDEEKVFLNLAGEKKRRLDFANYAVATNYNVDKGEMCDLWQIKAKFFKPGEVGAFDERAECFVDNNGDAIALRGLKLPTKVEDLDGFLYLLGFSDEIRYDGKGHFANTDRRLDDFLADAAFGVDEAYGNFYQNDRDYLGFASSLKLHGENIEIDWGRKEVKPPDQIFPPPRLVFGNVFSRFILLSFFRAPSIQGGAREIPFSTNANADLGTFKKHDGSEVKFQPDGPYTKYMSRIVTGFSANAYRLDGNPAQLDNTLSATDFKGTDNVSFVPSGKFSEFAKDWVKNIKLLAKEEKGEAQKRSIFARVGRFFQTREEFEQYAFKRNTGNEIEEFRLEGVVYVDADWVAIPPTKKREDKPDPLTIASEKIKGGVLIVKGDVILGDITRGVTSLTGAAVEDFQKKCKQENFLTFVSLRPTFEDDPKECIKFWGNQFMGVQAIALSPKNVETPSKMIGFAGDKTKPTFLFGGLAVSTPSMKDQVKDLEIPLSFGYTHCMNKEPVVTASIMPEVRSYNFLIE